jgi:hypothetical protein
LLGAITGSEGKVEIPAVALGCGPVQLQVIAIGDEGPKTGVFAAPLDIVVTE